MDEMRLFGDGEIDPSATLGYLPLLFAVPPTPLRVPPGRCAGCEEILHQGDDRGLDDNRCQMCWEKHCAQEWWRLIAPLWWSEDMEAMR